MIPVNYATISDNHPAFKMFFDKTVFIGAGSLKVYKVNTTTPVLTIPIKSSMISGNVVTVTYNGTENGLNKNTNYYVLVDGKAIKDNAGNTFAGVNDASVWNFKTGANFATPSQQEIGIHKFSVYPNPTTGIILIQGLPENQKTKIAVYTANG